MPLSQERLTQNLLLSNVTPISPIWKCLIDFFHPSLNRSSFQSAETNLVANMARREEKVAASSFRSFSSFLSFFMVSVTMDFSASYLLFRLARAPSAVCKATAIIRQCFFPRSRGG